MQVKYRLNLERLKTSCLFPSEFDLYTSKHEGHKGRMLKECKREIICISRLKLNKSHNFEYKAIPYYSKQKSENNVF